MLASGCILTHLILEFKMLPAVIEIYQWIQGYNICIWENNVLLIDVESIWEWRVKIIICCFLTQFASNAPTVFLRDITQTSQSLFPVVLVYLININQSYLKHTLLSKLVRDIWVFWVLHYFWFPKKHFIWLLLHIQYPTLDTSPTLYN